MRALCLSLSLLAALPMGASELTLDFSGAPTGKAPDDFKPLLAGGGEPGKWEIVMAKVPSLLPPLDPSKPEMGSLPVLTQLALDPTDERFPMLAYEGEPFSDFTVTTRFRILGGDKEQMAGLAFRLQDKRNFYVIRASALGRNVRFYKVVNGLRASMIGPSLEITTNTWHELKIRCKGNEIVAYLDKNLVIPPLQDNSFIEGKIAFWTKSDSICQFDGLRINYVPVVPLSKKLLKAALERYPRVLGLKLYRLNTNGDGTVIIASKDPAEEGQSGGKAELGAIEDANMYVGKSKGTVEVVMPLRDRNGDPVAAARVVMDSFPGQTKNNALVRAKPVVELMEKRLAVSRDPLE